ncbi:MAG: cellulose biosynthesis cyclic di-GMP-binding regulatory protein BcsB [Burkholderiales bacterium]
MKRLLTSALAAVILFAQPVFAPAQPVPDISPTETLPTETQRFPLKQLSGQTVLALRTANGSNTFTFGSRADELITHAVLHIRYTYSPALIPDQSHIKVILNDETVGVIPITKENAGRTILSDIEIDPRFFTDFNRLKLEFIGHYTTECEDPLHSSLWADISGASELEITTRPLALKSDLAMLPEPFFDKRDLHRLTLPFVFAASPTRPTLNAAGVASSWFGELAGWRGARFPTYLDQLPRGHAVVFATNTERPSFLEKHPKVEAPTLEVVTNPADGYSKLLLVLGRDGKDLKAAAQALALGSDALSGPSALIREVKEETPRQPYDAPNWVRLDRPMKFGELVASPQELQVFGHQPNLIRVNLRIPPDLFTWRSRGVPVDLKYKYSPPIRSSESRLTMSINDELLQAFNLRASGQGGESSRVRLPLLDDILLGDSKEVLLPAFKLGTRNQLQFSFAFTYFKEGNCRGTQVENVRAIVDANSTVDFSGFPHYAKMPNLNYFATAGYPFTRYADLSQTVVVLPDKPTSYDIETMLTLLGRMGESTGYPAIRVKLAGAGEDALFKDADLLVIGTSPQQALFQRWREKLPASLSATAQRVSQPVRGASLLYEWFGFGTTPDPSISTREKIESSGSLAALMGFESPVTDGRSVVAVTATAPQQLLVALDALDDSGQIRNIAGSVVFIHPQKVESHLVGKTYSVGHLPIWTAIWFPLSEHPVLLAFLSILSVLVFAFALWRTLKAIAAKRMQGEE